MSYNIYLGNNIVDNIYLGNTEITEADLLGSKLNSLRQSAFIPTGAITTKDGNLIVLTSDYNFILTVDGFQPLDLLMSAGIAVTTSDNKLISK